MKVSDYIVEYLIQKGITDVFGYPGGMVTPLMESFRKYTKKITAHVTYHEQGAAFAACGYAQASGKFGVAYATSGPGATNLITGICNAYYDSIPVLFITGQVNTYEQRGTLNVRQRGFQETDIVSMVSCTTKYAARIYSALELKKRLEYALKKAMSGRKGPVLLDIPMNVLRDDIEVDECHTDIDLLSQNSIDDRDITILQNCLSQAVRPVLLIGNGVKISDSTDIVRKLVANLQIPVVTTMLAVDIINDSNMNYGFIGAYGDRAANFIIAKSDLVITLGARLDVRQVGARRRNFAPNATIVRVDIDAGELAYRVRDDEIQICADLNPFLNAFMNVLPNIHLDISKWIRVCETLKRSLDGRDDRKPNVLIEKISEFLMDDTIITTDVGQNQVWAAQSLKIKSKQRIFFSGGHAAMGYSLPASIGCALASGRLIYSLNGDGGIQMNIQELQMIARENLPIKIIIFNNYALGMIRHFQEMYYNSNYFQTVEQEGYTVPSFEKIAYAYGLGYVGIESEEDLKREYFEGEQPTIIEVKMKENTYVFPKLEFGKPNQDQEPLLDRKLYSYLMNL